MTAVSPGFSRRSNMFQCENRFLIIAAEVARTTQTPENHADPAASQRFMTCVVERGLTPRAVRCRPSGARERAAERPRRHPHTERGNEERTAIRRSTRRGEGTGLPSRAPRGFGRLRSGPLAPPGEGEGEGDERPISPSLLSALFCLRMARPRQVDVRLQHRRLVQFRTNLGEESARRRDQVTASPGPRNR
jgi:hypothetical protein